MKTTVAELPNSRVKVEVEVDPQDLEGKVERTARRLGREIRIPGFRKGKVPPEMVLQRVGRPAVLEQTLQDALPEWYERALLESRIKPIGDPELNLESLPDTGEPLRFSIEVAVRPPAELGDYKGLEVGRAEPDVPEDAIDAELDRLREGFARLEAVERPAGDGDLVLIDYRGEVGGEPIEGGEARDTMIELGAGRVLEGLEEGLAGAEAGEDREVKVTFPDDYEPNELAGKEATFAVTVKEVREKDLPELDDEFASDASEFDTLAELRDDIRSKLAEALESRAEGEFRQAAVDAAVEQAEVEVPDQVVAARAAESWERIEHSLGHRGISPDRYLQMQGKTRDQVIEEAKPDAEQALKREAVLEAVAETEKIEVTDEELLTSLGPSAERESISAEKLLERLRSAGRDSLLRDELRLRKAVDLLAESAKPIPLEQAEAREAIWTPEKERAEAGKGGIWTPGAD